MIEFIKRLVESHSGTSSKRFAGLTGWFTCLAICMYCTCKNIQAPDITDFLFVCSTTLLGVDSVTGIWKKNINIENKDK